MDHETPMKTEKGNPKPYHYTECGLDNVYLVNGVTRRKTPRGEVIQIADLEGLHRAIGRRLVGEKKSLSGKEFRFLRHELKLSQKHLAALLGTDAQSIGRWEREEGKKPPPGPAQAVIRLLYNEKLEGNRAIAEPLEQLAELDEQFEIDEDIRLTETPEGWAAAA